MTSIFMNQSWAIFLPISLVTLVIFKSVLKSNQIKIMLERGHYIKIYFL